MLHVWRRRQTLKPLNRRWEFRRSMIEISLTGGVADVLIDTVIKMEEDEWCEWQPPWPVLCLCLDHRAIGHYLTLAPASFLVLISLSLSLSPTQQYNFLSLFLRLCFVISVFLPTVHSTSHILTQRSCPMSGYWIGRNEKLRLPECTISLLPYLRYTRYLRYLTTWSIVLSCSLPLSISPSPSLRDPTCEI